MQKTALSGSLFLYKYKKNSDIEYRICEVFATFVVYILTNTESVSLFSLVNVGNLSSSENERTSSHAVPIGYGRGAVACLCYKVFLRPTRLNKFSAPRFLFFANHY